MALDPTLVQDLDRILRRFGARNGVAAVRGGSGKALEAWLMMRLALKASQSGRWNVSLRRGDGTPLPRGTNFRLPAGQSGIAPANVNGPGHVRLERGSDGLTLELHSGLQWLGRSGATHEFDVSVVPHDIAGPLRTNGGGHPRGLPVAAYECKDRDNSGSIDEMRQKISRLFDVVLVTRPSSGPCRIYQSKVAGPSWGRRSSQYRKFFERGSFGVVRVGTFASGAKTLGKHYHVQLHQEVYQRAQTIVDIETKWMALLDSIDDLV